MFVPGTVVCFLPMVLQRGYCWHPMVLQRGYSFLPIVLQRGDTALVGTFLCSSGPTSCHNWVVSRVMPLKLHWPVILAWTVLSVSRQC